MERSRSLSLYKLTAVRIIVNLWNLTNFNDIDPRDYVPKKDRLEKNRSTIVDKISHLPLPNTVQEEMKTQVLPIGLRILDWIQYHECFFNKPAYSARDFVPHITWTPIGTIDQPITGEALMGSDYLIPMDRFQLACIYCQEERIWTIWRQLGSVEITAFVSSKQESLPILVGFWYHRLTGDLDKIPPLDADVNPQEHPDKYGFVLAVSTKNETAVRWFWKKIESELRPEERENFLIDGVVYLANQRPNLIHTPPLSFSNEHCASILLFLLEQISEAQIKVLGEKLSAMDGNAELLKYLLDWPYQKCLGKLARLLRGSLGPEDYVKVLLKIIDKIEDVHEKDYDYRGLYANFWGENSALNERLGHAQITQLLVRLINIGNVNCNRDVDNIISVIGDTSAGEKQKLATDEDSLQKVCFALVKRGLWSVHELLLLSCAGGENDLNEQKLKVFNLVGLNICKDLIVRQKSWNLVHEFAKWSNLPTEMTANLHQQLEEYEADYHERLRNCRSRKRNAVSKYGAQLTKKLSR